VKAVELKPDRRELRKAVGADGKRNQKNKLLNHEKLKRQKKTELKNNR